MDGGRGLFLADYGDTLKTAFHRPRIEASEGALVIGIRRSMKTSIRH
jgi:hypothetical protein